MADIDKIVNWKELIENDKLWFRTPTGCNPYQIIPNHDLSDREKIFIDGVNELLHVYTTYDQADRIEWLRNMHAGKCCININVTTFTSDLPNHMDLVDAYFQGCLMSIVDLREFMRLLLLNIMVRKNVTEIPVGVKRRVAEK